MYIDIDQVCVVMTEAGDGVSWDPGRGRHPSASDGRAQTPDTGIVPWAETQTGCQPEKRRGTFKIMYNLNVYWFT